MEILKETKCRTSIIYTDLTTGVCSQEIEEIDVISSKLVLFENHYLTRKAETWIPSVPILHSLSVADMDHWSQL